MPTHVVRQGDCITSLAEVAGFFWEVVWNHPENSSLRELREDPNQLMSGDIVFIPERERREETGSTDDRHRFRRKGIPALFRLQLLLDGEPRANEPYELYIDNARVSSGTTDDQGVVEGPLPPLAREGRIVIGSSGNRDIYNLRFGNLDPADTESGIRQRLMNLGIDARDNDLTEAIKAFQHLVGLEPTGTPDDETIARLRQIHDTTDTLPQQSPQAQGAEP